jgi:hypothetical protein
MRTAPRSTPARSSIESHPAPTDRRRRVRLRDLCDEVLASFRMASQPDQFSEQDRAEGRALLASVVHRTR